MLLVLLIVAPLGTYDGFQVRSDPDGPWRPNIYFGIETPIFGMLVELVQKWLKDLHPWFGAVSGEEEAHD